MNYIEIGQRISELRKKAGISQKQLSEQIGYDASMTVSRMEKGLVEFDVDQLLKIAKALNTSYDYLVGITNDPSRTNVDDLWLKLRILTSSRMTDSTELERYKGLNILSVNQCAVVDELINYLKTINDEQELSLISEFIQFRHFIQKKKAASNKNHKSFIVFSKKDS